MERLHLTRALGASGSSTKPAPGGCVPIWSKPKAQKSSSMALQMVRKTTQATCQGDRPPFHPVGPESTQPPCNTVAGHRIWSRLRAARLPDLGSLFEQL
jgi:hypothetical protein